MQEEQLFSGRTEAEKNSIVIALQEAFDRLLETDPNIYGNRIYEPIVQAAENLGTRIIGDAEVTAAIKRIDMLLKQTFPPTPKDPKILMLLRDLFIQYRARVASANDNKESKP